MLRGGGSGRGGYTLQHKEEFAAFTDFGFYFNITPMSLYNTFAESQTNAKANRSVFGFDLLELAEKFLNSLRGNTAPIVLNNQLNPLGRRLGRKLDPAVFHGVFDGVPGQVFHNPFDQAGIRPNPKR